MKIKSFHTMSPVFQGGEFDGTRPVCVFSESQIFLLLMCCLLDGESNDTPIDESKAQEFVSRVCFEVDGEEIELCGVLCDDQSFFVGVKDGEHFSVERTKKIIDRLRALKRDEKNNYNFHNKYLKNEYLSEVDFNIANFYRFVEIAKEESARRDSRPIYIFDFFEHLDEAIEVQPFIDALSSTGRQVFIGLRNYPVERFEKYEKVQIV